MNIKIICIEKRRPSWAEEAFKEYERRFNKSVAVEWCGCKPVKKAGNLSKKAVLREEGAKLLSSVKKRGIIISLDKKGKVWDTEGFKIEMDKWQMKSNNLFFLIGGSNGLSKECIERSDVSWSLSDLTFPHSFVPFLVLEQIYRVWSINQKHPYHK